MNDILPVVVGGGRGTRLWPQSRTESPKQFHKVNPDDDWTLFQSTVMRHASEGLFRDPICVVGAGHVPHVRRQIAETGLRASYVVEPEGRNTGPALAAAALLVCRTDPSAILLTLPSDHVVGPDFVESIREGMAAVEAGYLVTFGIRPTGPESGFGYILPGPHMTEGRPTRLVEGFCEKPDCLIAEGLIANGALWASGIGMYRASDFVALFEKHAPDILEQARLALDLGRTDGDETRLDGASYALCRSKSTEEEVLQKAPEALVMVGVSTAWDDVGAWDAYHRIGEKDADGNVALGDAHLFDVRNSYVRSDGRLVAVIGLEGVVIVDTPDALLVSRMDRTQDVKRVVEMLDGLGRPEVHRHLRRPDEWGHRRTLCRGGDLPVEEIAILSGATATIDAEPHVRNLLVTDGHLDICVAGRREQLAPGASFPIAAGQAATLVCGALPTTAILAATRSGPALMVISQEKSVHAA